MTTDAAYRHNDNSADALLRVDRSSAVAALLPADGVLAGGLREFVRHVAVIYEAHLAAVTAMIDDVVFTSTARGVTDQFATPSDAAAGSASCATVILHDAPVLITDTRDHPRHASNRLIMANGMRSYAGVPLPLGNRSVGTLCVMDERPFAFNDEDLHALQRLAVHAVQLLHDTRHGG